jgi:hypothetical protein
VSDVALADVVSLDQLTTTLDELAPHLEFLWMERPDGAELVRFDAPVPLARCVAGRAFGAECDVRWARTGGQARVMIATSGPRPGHSFAHQLDLESGIVAENTSYVLWGVRNEGVAGWSEPHIPRLLSYPLATSARRVLLEVILYTSSVDGTLVASRYTGLRGDAS